MFRGWERIQTERNNIFIKKNHRVFYYRGIYRALGIYIFTFPCPPPSLCPQICWQNYIVVIIWVNNAIAMLWISRKIKTVVTLCGLSICVFSYATDTKDWDKSASYFWNSHINYYYYYYCVVWFQAVHRYGEYWTCGWCWATLPLHQTNSPELSLWIKLRSCSGLRLFFIFSWVSFNPSQFLTLVPCMAQETGRQRQKSNQPRARWEQDPAFQHQRQLVLP